MMWTLETASRKLRKEGAIDDEGYAFIPKKGFSGLQGCSAYDFMRGKRVI